MKTTVTVDIGTTSVKLGLLDEAGQALAARQEPTPVARDAAGDVYLVDALVEVVERFVTGLAPDHRRAVRRVAVAGVGESGGLVLPDLRLASPMVLWHDHRGQPFLDRLGPGELARVYPVTGLPVNANYALSKVALALEQARSSADGAMWLNISEYLAAHLTGARWAEYSLASRTMALDLTTRGWSREMCGLVGVDVGVFPGLRAAGDGVALDGPVAERLGLDTSVQVHVAGHDHMVGGVGAALQAGELLNSTGTTEGLLMLRGTPDLGPTAERHKLANGIACDGTTSTLFASIPTGGSAFRTLRRMLDLTAASLAVRVETVAARYLAGSVDLGAVPVVVPHFRGSPPPEKDAAARGLVANLGTDVTADDLILGCFLGMAVQFRRVLELFPVPPTTIKVIGPASRNSLWSHLKADLLGRDLDVADVPEVVSRGAQALASAETCDWQGCRPHTVAADESRHRRLEEWYEASRPAVARLTEVSW